MGIIDYAGEGRRLGALGAAQFSATGSLRPQGLPVPLRFWVRRLFPKIAVMRRTVYSHEKDRTDAHVQGGIERLVLEASRRLLAVQEPEG